MGSPVGDALLLAALAALSALPGGLVLGQVNRLPSVTIVRPSHVEEGQAALLSCNLAPESAMTTGSTCKFLTPDDRFVLCQNHRKTDCTPGMDELRGAFCSTAGEVLTIWDQSQKN